jgi:hypothetical protein
MSARVLLALCEKRCATSRAGRLAHQPVVGVAVVMVLCLGPPSSLMPPLPDHHTKLRQLLFLQVLAAPRHSSRAWRAVRAKPDTLELNLQHHCRAPSVQRVAPPGTSPSRDAAAPQTQPNH